MEGNHDKIMYMLGEINGTLKNVEAQTIKTNGRINKLEEKTETHDRFIETFKVKAGLVTGGISLAFVVLWEFSKEWVKSKING